MVDQEHHYQSAERLLQEELLSSRIGEGAGGKKHWF